jgi:hypothetical protein
MTALGTSRFTVHYDRATPVRISDLTALDSTLDQIAADPEYRRFPVLVSIATEDDELVLDVLLGVPAVSFLVWHEGFTDIRCSTGTLPQDPDLAFNFGGTRTDAYQDCLIPVSDARAAVREFAATGLRPASIGWQEPRL